MEVLEAFAVHGWAEDSLREIPNEASNLEVRKAEYRLEDAKAILNRVAKKFIEDNRE